MRTTTQAAKGLGMRTTLELPDPLFARLTRSAITLPRLDEPVAIEDHQLSNAALFELLDP
jgi:hypothetical protein